MKTVKDLVGLEYEPYEFEIEKGKIREFAQAIGENDAIYYDIDAAREQGFVGIPIPLTFLTVVEFWGKKNSGGILKEYGVNPVRVLHGEQAYDLIEPIYAGDKLSVTSKIIKVDVKQGSTGGMDIITTENRYTNQHNQLVATSTSVLIHRH